MAGRSGGPSAAAGQRPRTPADDDSEPSGDERCTPARRAAPQAQQPPSLAPRRPGISQAWVLIGAASYLAMSLLATQLLASSDGWIEWREQVSPNLYDRSAALFGAALAIDALNALYELRTTKLDFALLPCFIKAAATTTNLLLRFGVGAIARGTGGRILVLQRYVCWMHTTPTILLLLRLMVPSLGDGGLLWAVACDEVMLVTGAAAVMTTGPLSVFLAVVSHLACLPVLFYIHRALKESAGVIAANAARSATLLSYYLIMAMWLAFGLVWDVAALGWISLETEEALNLACDFCAKVVFSSSLMLSSFKFADNRREGVMRQIEAGNKQALVAELNNILEQKGRFMSSVSHELRTPLNGIIGISEGMLSGCCGVLPDVVRRQVYVIRTSGARLLALINDVMDAAALRQDRLILAKGRVALRPAAGDVVDLTRSLAEPDVHITNLVPPDLFVCADGGRLVQVLNNLLSNAAKFTHHGTISVDARYHPGGHEWVEVTVRDTGIGIPRGKMRSIFLPFEQADGSISRKYGGFGLGLSIVQELVRAHGGTIWATSSVNKGSAFTFLLPAWPDTASPPPTPGPPPAAPAGAAAPPAPAPLTPVEAAAGGAPAAGGGDSGAAAGGAVGSSRRPLRREESSRSIGNSGDGSGGVIPPEFSEVPYDAAQLSALASTRPFVAAAAAAAAAAAEGEGAGSGSGGGSGGGVQQRVPSAGDLVRAARPSYHSVHGRYQVLSVDDDHVNQTVMQSLLGSAGYELLLANSGQEALSLMESAPLTPDLILLDVMMPDLTGTEVCRRLRARYPGCRTPIIMVSARVDEEAVVSGLDVGADDYITKPFKRNEFLARIRTKLEMVQQDEIAAERASSAAATLPGATSAAGAGPDGPIATAGRVGSLAAECEGAALLSPDGSGTVVPSSPPVVLCVDDDEVNQLVLQGMLHSQDYGYLKARTGEEGLACFAPGARAPDLVLVDSSLPDMRGLSFVQLLRQQHSKAALPIIILTARHHERSIVEGLDSGANDYVTKPFRRSELMARIRMHLRGAQRAATAAAGTAAAAGAAGGPPLPWGALAGPLPAAAGAGVGALAAGRVVGGGAAGPGAVTEEQRLLLSSEQEVPMISVQVSGLDGAIDALPPGLAAALLTRLIDLGDLLVEKYAVTKVEATDTSMVLAALQGLSYGPNRASLDQQRSSIGSCTTPQHLSGSTLVSTATGATGSGAAGFQAFCQLLLLAEELLQALPGICDELSAQHAQRAAAAGAAAAGARGGVSAAALAEALSQLGLRVALHLGPVQSAVLGTRRPRLRVFGPGVQAARAASAAAAPGAVTATPAAAVRLAELGVRLLHASGGGDGDGTESSSAATAASVAAAWAAAADVGDDIAAAAGCGALGLPPLLEKPSTDGGRAAGTEQQEEVGSRAAVLKEPALSGGAAPLDSAAGDAGGGNGATSPRPSPTHSAAAALRPAALALLPCGEGAGLGPCFVLLRDMGGMHGLRLGPAAAAAAAPTAAAVDALPSGASVTLAWQLHAAPAAADAGAATRSGSHAATTAAAAVPDDAAGTRYEPVLDWAPRMQPHAAAAYAPPTVTANGSPMGISGGFAVAAGYAAAGGSGASTGGARMSDDGGSPMPVPLSSFDTSLGADGDGFDLGAAAAAFVGHGSFTSSEGWAAGLAASLNDGFGGAEGVDEEGAKGANGAFSTAWAALDEGSQLQMIQKELQDMQQQLRAAAASRRTSCHSGSAGGGNGGGGEPAAAGLKAGLNGGAAAAAAAGPLGSDAGDSRCSTEQAGGAGSGAAAAAPAAAGAVSPRAAEAASTSATPKAGRGGLRGLLARRSPLNPRRGRGGSGADGGSQ